MAKGREVYAKPTPATRQTACLSVGPFRQADCRLLALSAKMTIDLYQKYNNRQETGRAMKPLSIILSLAFAALTLVSAPSLASQDEGRPRLERYASYDAFLKAMVAWESRQGSITAPAASIPASAPVADSTPSTRPIPLPEGVDPASETAPPPLAITGPEDLEVAVELAKDISHPDYKAPIRYNRSTHISFPLPSIDGSDMSQASIAGGLGVKQAPIPQLPSSETLPPPSEDLSASSNQFAQRAPVAQVSIQTPINITVETTY